MGQRLTPSLAIAFMSRVEAPVLGLRPLLYCRCIDDCFVFSAQKEMDKCFELLNEQSEYIKFTWEKPNDDWILFQTKLRISVPFQALKKAILPKLQLRLYCMCVIAWKYTSADAPQKDAVMYVGIEVTHPTSNEGYDISIASVVANIDLAATR
uniref:Reverse transcriptase domain-containing protein n=1 Tax=Angiostrongylus cantonensis TaxID=6313 RepID=A0A0K0D3T0_ANGCA